MARTFVSRLTAALLIVSWLGCATGGLNSGNSSGNSSAGSNNSSAGSNNSSNASAGSSNNSRESSASSQTNGNQTSQDSTANSSRGTTENSSRSNSSNNGDYGPLLTTAGLSVVVAGLGLLIWALAVRSARAEPSVPAAVPPPAPAPGAPNAPQPGEVPGTSPPPLPPPSPAQVQAAQVFLRANYAQLQQDLALGAGRSIEDLAAAAEIRRENLGRFGRVLRANRRELISLLNGGTPTETQSLAWLRRVGELASKDELLHRDAQAFAERYAAAR